MKKTLIALTVIASLAANYAYAESDKIMENTATVTDSGKATSKRDERRQKLLGKLSEGNARLFKSAEQAHELFLKDIKEKSKAIRKEMKALLMAEKFDKDAYMKKSAELTALHSNKYIQRASIIADLASKFSVEERKILEKAFYGKRGKKHNKKKNKKEEKSY